MIETCEKKEITASSKTTCPSSEMGSSRQYKDNYFTKVKVLYHRVLRK